MDFDFSKEVLKNQAIKLSAEEKIAMHYKGADDALLESNFRKEIIKNRSAASPQEKEPVPKAKSSVEKLRSKIEESRSQEPNSEEAAKFSKQEGLSNRKPNTSLRNTKATKDLRPPFNLSPIDRDNKSPSTSFRNTGASFSENILTRSHPSRRTPSKGKVGKIVGVHGDNVFQR
jgi:hypothetical protein